MNKKSQRKAVNGVLLFDKPLGLSSNQALQKVKYLYNAISAGHTGTLDPLASGLLPICLGEASKFSSGLLDADKTYEASIRLGITTSTDDAEGEIVKESSVPALTSQIIADTLQNFRGQQMQLPPMYSALKVAGKALYHLARQGIDIERQPRQITIYILELIDFTSDTLRIKVRCSKGTYIRVLAKDIGNALACGAHLSALRRTSCGFLSLDQAINLSQLEALDLPQRMQRLQACDYLLADMPQISINAQQQQSFTHGNPVLLDYLAKDIDEGNNFVRVYQVQEISETKQEFLGVGEWRGQPRQLWPKRLLIK